jgi:hypothetical protein
MRAETQLPPYKSSVTEVLHCISKTKFCQNTTRRETRSKQNVNKQIVAVLKMASREKIP